MKNILTIAGIGILLAIGIIGGVNYIQPKMSVGGNYRENTQATTMLINTSTNFGWGEDTSRPSGNGGLNVQYYRNLGVEIAGTSVTGTYKLACSLANTEPVWTSPRNATNTWDYVELIDTKNGTSVDGDTGITFSNTTGVRNFEANFNNFRWCNVYSTSTSGGTAIITLKPADNQ